MFENLKSGWALGKQVRKLVYSDRGLIFYPILMALVVFAEFAILFLPLVITSFIYVASPNAVGLLGYLVVLFVFYLASAFTSTYILVALLLAFRAYAAGKPITLGVALHKTTQYTKYIFEWALFYSIILLILRIIEQRLGLIGRIILGVAAGIALSIATIFVVPVIIDNKVGPISAMKQSASFFIHNFGKTVGGLIYADLYNAMFIVAGLLIFMAGILYVARISLLGGLAVFTVGLLIFIFGIIMNYLTTNVYKLILYDYINTGKLPSGISKELVDSTMAKMRSRKQPAQQPSNA